MSWKFDPKLHLLDGYILTYGYFKVTAAILDAI